MQLFFILSFLFAYSIFFLFYRVCLFKHFISNIQEHARTVREANIYYEVDEKSIGTVAKVLRVKSHRFYF